MKYCAIYKISLIEIYVIKNKDYVDKYLLQKFIINSSQKKDANLSKITGS